MTRISGPPASKFFSLIIFALMFAGDAGASDSLRSVILKNRYSERDFFYLKRDNSLDEMWDAFMVMKKANSGDPVAQHELGLRYLTGKDFEADTQKAALWIGKAAEQNLLPAKYNFGILLNNGWGVEWDPFGAYRDFQYAAVRGMTEAEYAYGLLLTDDLTVNRNLPEAFKWISAASDSGYEPAKEVLAEFKVRGISFKGEGEKTPSGVKTDTASSRDSYQSVLPAAQPVFIDFDSKPPGIPSTGKLLQDLLDAARGDQDSSAPTASGGVIDTTPGPETIRSIYRSAEFGTPEALLLIGRMHERGIGIDRDIYLSSLYYIRAARSGSPWAPLLLWELTREEDYFPTLKKRVEAGEPGAFFVWSQLSRYGIDRQLAEIQAMEFLNQAASMNFPDAMVELGLHLYGTGNQKERGVGLLVRARELGNKEARLRLHMIDLMDDLGSRPDTARFQEISAQARGGSVLAEMLLGYCYRNGKDVRLNIPQAVRFYRRASGRGNNAAHEALREMYDRKRPDAPEFQIRE